MQNSQSQSNRVKAASPFLEQIWNSSAPKITDSEYFTIGQYVLVRKQSDKGGWKPAKVIRPLVDEITGERSYSVEAIGSLKSVDHSTRKYYYNKGEIRAMPMEYRYHEEMGNWVHPFLCEPGDFVWALIHFEKHNRWIPVIYIYPVSGNGYKVEALTGELKNLFMTTPQLHPFVQ
ncbi:hypothetical protein BDN70DRAFT_896370 [Pholiota conissans]|uniref:Uncharacterized protein n=1 Tax=Pholiota conissans TaxID=109636 RepID=A0A9P6CRZ8_9AGAR|nr:hypothetical protein BDN70DRAFT_896370 [Pholiota conissans]